MITRSRISLTAATVLMVLMFSAMWTVPAFADDTTPPPTETPTEVVPPVEEEAVEAQPAEAVVVETAPADDVVVEEPAPQEETVAELLAQLPEGTDLIVTDANGEALPLASTEAAEAIPFVDPVWCPTGVTPQNGTGGCSTSYASLALLITGFVPTGNGVIWIQSGADATPSGTALTIDGATNWAAAANFSLALQGGWSGTMGTTTVNVETPSIFDQTLSIINWNAAVSLADIVIDGAASNTATENSALLIETTGNIQLTRVTLKNSQNSGAAATNGATLDNSTSTTASTVYVNNGYFQNNDGDGLHIYSAGMVTMANIYANGNDLGGAIIDNSFAATDQAVTLSGAQEYNNNGNTSGLDITSNGLVTITSVIANGNGGNGVGINNSTSATNQGVTILGTNNFNTNGNGLYVLSQGIITTYNIIASDNDNFGAQLDNCDSVGAGCRGASGVNVYGSNLFYGNGADGLNVETFGAINAYSLTASYNGGHGARLENQLFNESNVDAAGGIMLYGYNVFNGNDFDGLNASSHGDIIAYSNLTASENTGSGASLNATKLQPTLYCYVAKVKGKKKTVCSYITAANISLYGVNKFDWNNGDGLYASSNGTITLYNVSANFNGASGANLTNTTQGYGIGLYGTNSFAGNCSCGAGLLINSAGTVTLYNITAEDNAGNGVDIDNTASTTGLGVTLYGNNTFNGNATGLNVLSHGIITTNGISAYGNTEDGVHLDNCHVVSGKCSVSGAPYVYMLGNNYFSLNGEDGLDITSFGQIITYNLTASNNGLLSGGHGARLNNQWFNNAVVSAESVGTITLYGTNVFRMNADDGLNASSSNDIITYNLTANYNGDNGVSLSVNKTTPTLKAYSYVTKVKGKKKTVTVYYNQTAGNVTLYGDNNFVRNDVGDGLNISADGAITVYNLTANGNGQSAALGVGNGATLNNCLASCNNPDVNPVTIYGFVNVNDNNWRGLDIDSPGAITLSNIIANGNLGVGVRANNQYNSALDSATRGVTITGTNIFNENDSTGLVVLSYGAISLNSINAYNNGDDTPGSTSGAVLNNAGGIAPKNITLTGINSFVGNYFWGLQFTSDGAVNISRISADGNDYGPTDPTPGPFIGGGVLGTANTITITCGHMFGNGVTDPGRGYNLAATGVLTLNGIYSAGNGNPTDIGTGSSVVRTSACALP
ncbi:MAG: hypothetical protein H7Y59_13570 [Anaerolineales bacterium]|nr:hypothetical protein [Anaerolineales bacterium]